MERRDKLSLAMDRDSWPYVIQSMTHKKKGFCRMSAETQRVSERLLSRLWTDFAWNIVWKAQWGRPQLSQAMLSLGITSTILSFGLSTANSKMNLQKVRNTTYQLKKRVEYNLKKFWEEIIAYFTSIRHGSHRKPRVQQFFVVLSACLPSHCLVTKGGRDRHRHAERERGVLWLHYSWFQALRGINRHTEAGKASWCGKSFLIFSGYSK
jgi:hypothetical protein